MKYIAKILFFTAFLFNLAITNAQDELRILPLGNSLTYGYYDGTYPEGNRISYRYRLYTHLMNAGYNFSFKGHISSGYNYLPGSYAKNGGISGVRDDQLASVMENGYYYNPNTGFDVDIVSPRAPYLSVAAHQCDLVLLHIGTNDLSYGDIYSLSEINTILDAIDDYESTYSTEVLVIVAKIISTKHGSGSCTIDPDVTTYNNNLQSIINSRISGGDKIKLIDLQCGAGINYNTQMINDLHPTQEGYDLMGDAWFQAIDEIHNAPVINPITVTPVQEGNSFAPINLNSYVSDDYTSDANITWSLASSPVNLNVIINPDRTLSVSPISTDWSGTEVVTLRATDKGRYIEKLKKSSTVDITFTIDGMNDPPVILSQTKQFNLQEDQTFQIVMNDLEVEDVDNGPGDLTLNLKPGANYTVNGSTIQPAENHTGDLYVNITVSDLEDESSVFQVQAYFSAINDEPVITGSLPVELGMGENIEITKSLLTIFDPDNDPSDITLYVLGGNNYSVIGSTVYPAHGFYGNLYVNLRVMDLEYLSDIYSMEISVIPSNLPPEFTSIPTDTIAEITWPYNYDAKADDPNDDPVNFIGLTIPAFLTFVESTGVLIGIPNEQDKGVYQVSLGASDGTDTTLQNFTIYVAEPGAIRDEQLSARVQLYPNPAQSFIYITYPAELELNEIKLIDLSGRIIYQNDLVPVADKHTIRVDFGSVTSGTYILILTGDEAVITKQVVIQNQ